MVLFFECKVSRGIFKVNFCHFMRILLIMKENAVVFYSFVTEKQDISGIAAIERGK